VHNGSSTVIKVEKGTQQEQQQQQQVQEQQQLLSKATGTVTAEPAAVTAAKAEAPLTETSAAAAAQLSGGAAMEANTTATLPQPLSPAVTAVEATAGAAEGVSTFGGTRELLCTSGNIDAAGAVGGAGRGSCGGGVSGDDSRVSGSSAAVMDGKGPMGVGGVEDDDDEAEPEVVGECHAGCVSKGLASCTCGGGAAAAPGSKGRWLQGEGSRWKMHMVVWNDPHELEAAGLLEGSGFGGGVNEV
jgi:hypothetical protein